MRVPDDAPDLARAVDLVADGGVVELAPGIYFPPPTGYRVRAQGRAFTIRAAQPGTVTLSGAGVGSLLSFAAPGSGIGQPVRVVGLVLEDGFSDRPAAAGGVTVRSRRVTFERCIFRGNRTALASGAGGALRADGGSIVVVADSELEDNSSPKRGGAIEVVETDLTVRRSRFVGNRTNVAGHTVDAVGGALYLLDSAVRVEQSHFEGNEAAWVGGAIYGIGVWDDDPGTFAATLEVSGSSFVGNVADRNPCCTVAGPESGGAIHGEDDMLLVIESSQLDDNAANWGGAISTYRNQTEITGSLFRRNRARLDDPYVAAGGAIVGLSSDFADSSTDGGAINRPAASVVVRNSLFEGEAGVPGATQGGCLAVLGDGPRQFGGGDVARIDDLAANRTRLVLEQVVLRGCDTDRSGVPGAVFGGAIYASLGDLSLAETIFLGNTAQGPGGAIAAVEMSRVEAADTSFARNVAATVGGAIFASGGELEVSGGFFVENVTDPNNPDPAFQRGSAIASEGAPSQPNRREEIRGTVRDSIFLRNRGVEIFEGQRRNTITYLDNLLIAPSLDPAYASVAGTALQPVSLPEVNSLVVPPGIDKGSGNRNQPSGPRFGRLIGAPGALSAGSGPTPPYDAVVGHAWLGAVATLEGLPLGLEVGVTTFDAPGDVSLVVDGREEDTLSILGSEALQRCQDALCLNGRRFLAEVEFRDFEGRRGTAREVAFRSDDSGLFYFFAPDNWEMLVKVLDACALNDRFWVFSAATTTVEYELRVTDLLTGTVRSYANPLGRAAPALSDTDAFPCDSSASLAPRRQDRVGTYVGGSALRVVGAAGTIPCAAGANRMCLNRQRFGVEVEFRDFAGGEASGRVVAGGSADSGLFYFFEPDNWEMLIKVLDACALNGHFWVFAAATTTVGFELSVTDGDTGRQVSYTNSLGQNAETVTDTLAFPCSG
ncbi:MAG TPA: hypothetical protein VMV46_07070 [Thermoanaerobaculia bacterium]|nr:hypothetical protein [Thermoanaerobaculia bacterium]